jgi:hypothetical protein
MMNLKHQFILLVALVAIVQLSCSKDCVTQKSISGEWLWIESTGTWGPFTPEMAGYNEILLIDDFYFIRLHNDSLVFESQYDLVIRTDTLSGYTHFIQFAPDYDFAISIKDGELDLIEYQWYDGLTHHYKRN